MGIGFFGVFSVTHKIVFSCQKSGNPNAMAHLFSPKI
jgi:hypothetical protein